MRKIKKAVITAAGFGSRFLPVVKNIPKEMLPIIDKPILQYVVEECIEAGIEEIIIVVRQGNDVIKKYFQTESPEVKELLISQDKVDRFEPIDKVLQMKGITIIDQDPELPYGNGSPIITAKHLLEGEEAFAVLFADDLVLSNGIGGIKQVVDYYVNSDCEAVMGVQRVPHAEMNRYASVKPKSGDADQDEGEIEFLIEKPDTGTEPSNLASYGRFVVPFRIFDYLNAQATGKDNEVWLQDANDEIAKTGKYMYKVIQGHWYTTGDPVRYFEAQARFMLADKRYGADTKAVLEKALE